MLWCWSCQQHSTADKMFYIYICYGVDLVSHTADVDEMLHMLWCWPHQLYSILIKCSLYIYYSAFYGTEVISYTTLCRQNAVLMTLSAVQWCPYRQLYSDDLARKTYSTLFTNHFTTCRMVMIFPSSLLLGWWNTVHLEWWRYLQNAMHLVIC